MERDEVSIRDLRNHGGEVIDSVAHGARVTITRDGRAVATLLPAPKAPVPLALLRERRRHLPKVDPALLRADLDSVIDPSV